MKIQQAWGLKHKIKVGTLVIGYSILSLDSLVYAQNASIPDTSILSSPDKKTAEILDKLNRDNEKKSIGFLDKFLKCDGKNGNAEMGEYSDPDYYHIIDEKCTYSYMGGGM